MENKLTLARFQEYKARLYTILSQLEGIDDQAESQKKIIEYLNIQQELFDYDLSAIPFEEYQGMYLFDAAALEIENMKPLDLSKSHANIDFGVFEEIFFGNINFEGCNIRGLDRLDESTRYSDKTFDADYVMAHPEFFPSKNIPEEIRQKYYKCNITFADVLAYPELKICLNRRCFSREHSGGSYELINNLGFANALLLFEENPEFIYFITKNDPNQTYQYCLVNFDAKKFNSQMTYEEVKKEFYDAVAESLITNYNFEVKDLSILPKDFKKYHPDFYLPENVREDLKEFYYEGKLNMSIIRNFREIFEKQNIRFGIRRASGVQKIFKFFPNIYEYIDRYGHAIDKVFEAYYYNEYEEELAVPTTEIEKEELVRKYVIKYFNQRNNSISLLSEIKDFIKYVPLEEMNLSVPIVDFINKYGLENILKFNEQSDGLFDIGSQSYSSVDIFAYLELFAKEDALNPDSETNNYQDYNYLLKRLDELLVKIKNQNEFDYSRHLEEIPEATLAMFPTRFLDRKKLVQLLSYAAKEDQERMINTLENIFNEQKFADNYGFFQKHPEFIAIFKDKDIIFYDQKSEQARALCEAMGPDLFLEYVVKYGPWLNYLFVQQIRSDGLNNFIKDDEFNNLLLNCGQPGFEEKLNYFIREKINTKIKYNNEKMEDLELLPTSFKTQYPKLFLASDAPEELVRKFYAKESYLKLKLSDIKDHPEWISYLIGKDLDFGFEEKELELYWPDSVLTGDIKPLANGKYQVNGQEVEYNDLAKYVSKKKESFYSYLLKYLSYEELFEIILQYGSCLNQAALILNTKAQSKAQILAEFKTTIYSKIKFGSINYDDSLPEDFKKAHPEVFLAANEDQEFKTTFYSRKITPQYIKDHPEHLAVLKTKNLLSYLNSNDALSIYQKIMNDGYSDEQFLDYCQKYGKYLSAISANFVANSEGEITSLNEKIAGLIFARILKSETYYDESLPDDFKKAHPELFIADDAPQELKDLFYKTDGTVGLTFELLQAHRDWLPFLKDKNILLALQKGGSVGYRAEMFKLWEKYQDEEFLKIGLKNPTAVSHMIAAGKVDLLCQWYEKTHFIPHHVVMLNFPYDLSDKFLASGKKWSNIMRLDRYNKIDETKAALLKASMCFGVFDDDLEGYNQIIQLFSDVPREITQADYEKILETLKIIESNKDYPQDYIESGRELLKTCYFKNKEGNYSLAINPEQEIKKVKLIRELLETTGYKKVMTPNNAHKIFDAFAMEYDSVFRDFLLENMEKILTSDEYMGYISSMQRQFAEIKAINCNRTLTLDLALAYVISNKYKNIQPGNEALAEISNIAGYSQADFTALQQIYNYGKVRVFSSIPRVKQTVGRYTYEMLRLDDPLALAIGTLTDCCQKLHGAGESCMVHSMVDKNGRVFVIKNEQGNIESQSWVWRNKNVLCFDNIEIPDKAFTRATKKNGYKDQKAYTDEIYQIYQQAAEELIKTDELAYKSLLDEGKITQEQYDNLKITKITVGLGYNNIAESLQRLAPKDEGNLARPLYFNSPIKLNDELYTDDSKIQYIIAGEANVPKTDLEAPTIHADDYTLFDDSNFKALQLLTFQKLEIVTEKDAYDGDSSIADYQEEDPKIVSKLADNYYLNPETTRIIMNPNLAIIFDVQEDKIRIGDILCNLRFYNDVNPIDITNKVYIQIRLALNQLLKMGKTINCDLLAPEKLEIYNKVMNIKQEIDEERGLAND